MSDEKKDDHVHAAVITEDRKGWRLRTGRPGLDPQKEIWPVSDPRWFQRARPVLDFLSETRTWSEIESWADSVGLPGFTLRHSLAYLEDRGYARGYQSTSGLWLWRSNVEARRVSTAGSKHGDEKGLVGRVQTGGLALRKVRRNRREKEPGSGEPPAS